MLKVAVALNTSGLPLPIKKYPLPVFVIVNVELKVLPPGEASLLEPVLTAFTVLLNVPPLKRMDGLELDTSPSKRAVEPKYN